jgi:hypothetical protein
MTEDSPQNVILPHGMQELFDKPEQMFSKPEEELFSSTDSHNVHMMFSSDFIKGGQSLFNPPDSGCGKDSGISAPEASSCGDMILSTTDEDLFHAGIQPAQAPRNFPSEQRGEYERSGLSEDKSGLQHHHEAGSAAAVGKELYR